MVSGGLERAPIGHNSGTNDTKRTQEQSRDHVFSRHPELAKALIWNHNLETKQVGFTQADLHLAVLDKALTFGDLNLSTADSDDIKEESTFHADRCRSFVLMNEEAVSNERLLKHLESVGIDRCLDEKLITLLQEPRWWRRQIYRAKREGFAYVRRGLGFVNSRHTYVDIWSLAHQRRLEIRKRQYLEETRLTNELGASITLADVHDRSVSNPAIRRAELMTRLAGINQYAKEKGDKAVFVTLTTPSRMHRLSRDRNNANYDGTHPKGAGSRSHTLKS